MAGPPAMSAPAGASPWGAPAAPSAAGRTAQLGAGAAAVAAVAPSAAPPAFPLTSQYEAPLAPPPNPYGTGASSASILGAAGQFAIAVGIEVRVGRDPAACPITLTEPRVSGIHATLKFDAGQLMVRDEGSNNGTYLAGARLPARAWTPVANGASLRFGPVEFTVKID